MFVGDMTLPGQIGLGECRSSAGFALEYPNPGAANTIVAVQGIGFKKPTGGKCFTKASINKTTTSVSGNFDNDDDECDSPLSIVSKFVLESIV